MGEEGVKLESDKNEREREAMARHRQQVERFDEVNNINSISASTEKFSIESNVSSLYDCNRIALKYNT